MLEEYVSSGSYSISTSEDKVLVALLGTCVGLVLCDRTAGVGGLIHFLLPEPSGMTTSWEPENFATTGLLPFIDKLVEAGAHKGQARSKHCWWLSSRSGLKTGPEPEYRRQDNGDCPGNTAKRKNSHRRGRNRWVFTIDPALEHENLGSNNRNHKAERNRHP